MALAGTIDLGLVTGDVDNTLLQEIDLGEYVTCVVVHPDHPLAAKASISAAELAGSQLILMEAGTNLRAHVDRLLSEVGVEEQVALELDNVEAIKRMIEVGLGISMLPEVAIRDEVKSGRLAAIELTEMPASKRRIRIVLRRDRFQSAAVKEFIQLLIEESSRRPIL